MTSHLLDHELDALLDGQLDAEHTTRLNAHLERCTSCREALAAQRAHQERVTTMLGDYLDGQHPSTTARWSMTAYAARASVKRRAFLMGVACTLFVVGGGVWIGSRIKTDETRQQVALTDTPRPPGERLGEVPTGWHFIPSSDANCDVGLSQEDAHSGKSSSFLRAATSRIDVFCALSQVALAQSYRGKRIRMSAWVKTRGVAHKAGLWLRISNAKQEIIAFDNMQERPIQGTMSWTRHEVVLDVDEHATQLVYGVLLSGGGTIWIDDLSIEEVGPDVPTTNIMKDAPTNTGFEL